MIYTFPLEVPADTPVNNPAQFQLLIAPGTITQEFMTFPANCSGLVGARVKIRERVLWPSNPDVWIINDGYTFAFADPVVIGPDPEFITLEAYNLDAIFPKFIWLVLTVAQQGLSLTEVLDQIGTTVSIPGGLNLG